VALDMVPAAPPPPAVVPSAKESGRTPELTSPKAAINPRENSIEEKLQILKNLRDKELITEQEYVEKKRQILDDL
jgi:hypothetical protein